jgi:hypothetical protein
VSLNSLAAEPKANFFTREEADKVTYGNGFYIKHGERDGWLRYTSTTARGDVWIACEPNFGAWLLAISHLGVIAELGIAPVSVSDAPDGSRAVFAFSELGRLYAAMDRVYKLGVSLPDAPLAEFQKETAGLPRTTEAERLRVERVGQDVFRAALMEYWNGRCPLTGITDHALLRASHIVPWAECETDELRLDVHNGLLLSALWDAAFDSGLISFADDGTVLRSPQLTPAAADMLRINSVAPLAALKDSHLRNLARHRAKHGH